MTLCVVSTEDKGGLTLLLFLFNNYFVCYLLKMRGGCRHTGCALVSSEDKGVDDIWDMVRDMTPI